MTDAETAEAATKPIRRSYPQHPAEYKAEPVCPRCGGGWPGCADVKGLPEWARWVLHGATCDRYQWADDVCAECDEEMANEGEDA